MGEKTDRYSKGGTMRGILSCYKNSFVYGAKILVIIALLGIFLLVIKLT
jgi:hypothetical protein